MRQISNVIKLEMHHGDAALMLKYLAVEWLVKGVTRLQKDKKVIIGIAENVIHGKL